MESKAVYCEITKDLAIPIFLNEPLLYTHRERSF